MRAMSLCWMIAGALIVPGCSESGLQMADVSGTVRLNGKLVDEGAIQFIPADGASGPSAGAIIKNGHYHIDRKNGAMVGKNRVELRAFTETGNTVQDPMAPQGIKTAERVPAFPPEFNDQTTLTREVKSGSNTIDFDIQTTDKQN